MAACVSSFVGVLNLDVCQSVLRTRISASFPREAGDEFVCWRCILIGAINAPTRLSGSEG